MKTSTVGMFVCKVIILMTLENRQSLFHVVQYTFSFISSSPMINDVRHTVRDMTYETYRRE